MDENLRRAADELLSALHETEAGGATRPCGKA